MTSISRRSVIGGGVAAALAVGATAPAAEASAPLTFTTEEANLTGARVVGSTVTGHLRLFSGTSEVGVLRASSIVSSAVHDGDLSTQVLELATGTVVGVGLAHPTTLHGTFAIVGGTGTYAGARGSYVLSDRSLHLSLLS